MAQRNLTAQFKSFRDGFSARRGPRRRRRFHGNEYQDVELGLMDGQEQKFNNAEPSWVTGVDEIKNMIEEIKSKIKLLNQLHKNRLLVRFDNSESTKDREIDSLTNEITRIFRSAEKEIKQKLVNPSNFEKTSADFTVKENLKRQLAHELQELSMNFRKTQKEYMQRLRSQKGDLNGMNDILGLNQPNQSFKFQSEQDSMLMESLDNSQVLERDREIQKIAENVNELATIFQDLAVLVIDQGTMLDRIDYNLENVQLRTEKGLNELIVADQYSQNSRPFKCIMILLGVIVFEALILLGKSN